MFSSHPAKHDSQAMLSVRLRPESVMQPAHRYDALSAITCSTHREAGVWCAMGPTLCSLDAAVTLSRSTYGCNSSIGSMPLYISRRLWQADGYGVALVRTFKSAQPSAMLCKDVRTVKGARAISSVFFGAPLTRRLASKKTLQSQDCQLVPCISGRGNCAFQTERTAARQVFAHTHSL